MTANDICEKAKNLASKKTMYVKGCPGLRLTQVNKIRYSSNDMFNIRRTTLIFEADEETIGIDEVHMFNAIFRKEHFNNIGDIMERCHDISKNMDSIIPGEIVFAQDRAGVYIGDNKVITCSIDGIVEMPNEGFISHGKMMFVDYVDNELVDIVEKATDMEKVVNSIVEEINNDETDVEVRDGGTWSGDRVHELPSQAKSYDRGNGRRRS